MGGAIGVFDSGVGGLTVFRELKRELPNAKLIYLGDTARTPYGSKGPETIKRYAHECASFLLGRHISELVVACNTVSSHALEELDVLCGAVKVFGTISSAVDAALSATRTGNILVLGTKSTIRSSAFAIALKARAEVKVTQQACPLFVPLVEEGLIEGKLVDAAMDLYLGKIRNSDVDTVILGCTHYPLLRPALQKFFGSNVRLVDCASTLAKSVATYRAQNSRVVALSANGGDEFFSTDDPASFEDLASRILESSKIKVERIFDLAA